MVRFCIFLIFAKCRRFWSQLKGSLGALFKIGTKITELFDMLHNMYIEKNHIIWTRDWKYVPNSILIDNWRKWGNSTQFKFFWVIFHGKQYMHTHLKFTIFYLWYIGSWSWHNSHRPSQVGGDHTWLRTCTFRFKKIN